MKKRIIFIFLLFIITIIPDSIRAANVTVSLSCPSSAALSQTISCNVNVNSDILVNGLSAKYTLNNLSYVSFTPSSGFTSNYASSSGFAVGNNSGKKGSFTIGVIKLKVNNTGSFTIHSLDVSDNDFNSYSPSSKTANIRIKSTNTDLKSLSLSTGFLSPAFTSNITNYTATINSEKVDINATKMETNQTISGTGSKKLNYGTNKFNIVVTSEAGTKKTYTVTITRPDNRSSNNNLKILSTNQGTIPFDKNTTTYNLNVNSNITSIKINATLEDEKASFVSGYGARTINLNYGKNVVQIKVKSENGNIKTYTININRKDERSNNNYLKQLSLDYGEITFNKNTLQYNTSVQYEINKINVSATPEDVKSKVIINNPDLNVGNNTITINVTAENGAIRTYKIIVKRLTEKEKMSDNNNISYLRVLGHEIDFKKDVMEYDLNIKDEYALVFEITLEDPKANYIIEGNEDLKDGSIIKVISTSQSGIKKEYKFNVKKIKEQAQEVKQENINEKNNNNLFIGIIGFICGIVTTIVIGSIKRNLKNNKDKKNNFDININ